MAREKTIALEKYKREIAKKDLVIGLLTEYIGFDKAVEILRANDYDLRALAIDCGKKISQDKIDELRAYADSLKDEQSTL